MHNCEAIVALDKSAFMGLKSEGRMKRIKKEGGEEVKRATVNYLSL